MIRTWGPYSAASCRVSAASAPLLAAYAGLPGRPNSGVHAGRHHDAAPALAQVTGELGGVAAVADLRGDPRAVLVDDIEQQHRGSLRPVVVALGPERRPASPDGDEVERPTSERLRH
ncbi:hypothetical protein [Micromonospora globispora]|uniref:hypothetical protein n=1 Tax=Micromonospora globispora TaxID=1450148 RepID=UPI001FAF23FC|nr:hypothetical protein [Micromonospora globispora]